MFIRRSLLPLAVITAVALSCGAASAAGGGALSSNEFQQLRSLQARLKTVKPTSLSGYRAMLLACEETQMETPLLIDMRAFCDDFAQMNIVGETVMKQGGALCVARTHTPRKRLNCVANLYARWYPSIRGLYNADLSILHLATARKLGSRCVEYLAGTPSQIADAGKLAAETKRIIAAARRGSLTDFAADNGIFITDAARLTGALANGPGKITACRHQ